ncbi:YebC/PmpR family DNA-binding transcriptional regulator [bacterium]|nr:YebC/PmpR family DNA-binding transcriptional regulator [bacterium]
MSGHSKWSNIKHRKGRQDQKRGEQFGKISREIMVATKEGGPDPAFNFVLRSVIDRAREVNFPAQKIKDAIKSALDPGGATYEAAMYECFGPGGVGILIEVLTDNRNRTLGEVRTCLSKRGAHLATSGAVSHSFRRLGVVTVAAALQETEVLEALLDAGVEDYDSVETGAANTLVLLPLDCLEAALGALANAGEVKSELIYHATAPLRVEAEVARSVLALMGALEGLDDVRSTWANMEIPDSLAAGV